MIDGISFENLKAAVPIGPYWAVEESHIAILLQQLETVDLSVHAEAYNAARGSEPSTGTPYQMSGQTAILSISGTMTKKPVSLGNGSSTVELRRQIRHAARNPDVKSILMHIDSPGGQVDGLADLAKDFKNTGKHTVAFFEDLGASAAYYVGSQADEVYANDERALVGSIGTFAVVHDLSKVADQEGVKVHVLRSGRMKGALTPGVEVSDEALSEIQGHVNSFSEDFFQKVSASRGISVEDIANMDGRCFNAKEAHARKLIDGVHSLDDVLSATTRAQALGTRRTELYQAADDMVEYDVTASFNPPVKGKGGKRMENQALAAAFAAAGLSALSTAVATAGETPEAVAKAIGREFESVQAQTDPRIEMLDSADVKSAEDLKKLQADAVYGLTKENELRETAKKAAQAAFGMEKATAKADVIASMPRDLLSETVVAWEEIADEKVGRSSGNAGSRQTASHALDVIASGIDGEADTLVAATVAARGKTNGKVATS